MNENPKTAKSMTKATKNRYSDAERRQVIACAHLKYNNKQTSIYNDIITVKKKQHKLEE